MRFPASLGPQIQGGLQTKMPASRWHFLVQFNFSRQFSRFACMFERFKQKWNVSGTRLFLILCVFAITGLTTAYITRQITEWFHLVPAEAGYWLLKLAVLIFGYQFLILLVSVPFGQFRFFWEYEKKILRSIGRLFGRKP